MSVIGADWAACCLLTTRRDRKQFAGRGGGLVAPRPVQRDQIRLLAPSSASIREA